MDKVGQFLAVTDELSKLYAYKNKAYGNSFTETFEEEGMAMPRIRIGDKFRRFKTLSRNPEIDDLGEKIDDTLADMANYCIMTLMERGYECPFNKK